FLRQVNMRLAGALLAAAVSAKLSMLVAVPFFGIYLYNNPALRQRARPFVASFALASAMLWLPFLASESAIWMLFSNPEMTKVYQLAMSFGSDFSIYLVPFIYLLLLYFTWRIGRLNFDIFQAALGMAFLLLVLMTPAAPGWFIW